MNTDRQTKPKQYAIEEVVATDTQESRSKRDMFSKQPKSQQIQTGQTAMQVESPSFNTRIRRIMADYRFTGTGSITLGTFKQGVHGDIVISDSGIVVRAPDGTITFSLNSETGYVGP